MKPLSVVVSLFLAFAAEAQTPEERPCRSSGQVTFNVLSRVFQLRLAARVGTGFAVDVEGRQYIVTAKHLLEGTDIANPFVASIRVSETWIDVQTRLVGQGQLADVAVLAATSLLFDGRLAPIALGTAGITLGQPVRFLGFPFPARDIKNGFSPGTKHNLPFIKGGLLSALESGGGTQRRLWVDGHNNLGFSGGPVVFQPISGVECGWRIAGVVSGYEPERVRDLAHNFLPLLANSGLVTATAIEVVQELIAENPIGFQLSAEAEGSSD